MVMRQEWILRRQIVQTHQTLHRLGFAVANDGNTSIKVSDHKILITPKGLDKKALKPSQIVAINLEGKVLAGTFAPSSEMWMHIEAYKARPDVRAVIHAHPPYSIASTLAGISLEDPVLPEIVLAFGRIPTIPYTLTGTREMALTIAQSLKSHEGVILDRHGVVTLGQTIEDSLSKLERIEHTAKILLLAKQCGSFTPLMKTQVDDLLELRSRIK